MNKEQITRFREQERLAYIQGDIVLACALGDRIEALRYAVKVPEVSEIKTCAEEAYQYIIGEDFMHDLIEIVRKMSNQSVTKEDMKNLVNVMEDFQTSIVNEAGCAREELNKIINA
jgi:hypothetical protein